MMRRWVAFVLLTLSLSGCITQQTATTLNPDGSGTNKIRLGFSKDFLSLMQMYGGGSGTDMEEIFSSVDQLAEAMPTEWNPTSQPWTSDDGEFKGTEIALDFADPAMLEEQLSEGLGGGEGIMNFTNIEVLQENSEWVIKATIEPSESMNSSDMDMLSGMGQLGDLGSNAPSLIWSVTFPGKVTTWNEEDVATVQDNTITYAFPFPQQRTYTIEIRANAGVGLSTQTMVLIGGAVLAGVLLIGLGVWLTRRNRGVAAPVPNVVATSQAGAYPFTPVAPAAPSYEPLGGRTTSVPLTNEPMVWDHAAPHPASQALTTPMPPQTTKPLNDEPNPHPFD